ncbi:MAG: ribose-5-phosphate isomerase RpiA [Legionellales bacterium]|nr:ribose-5-phosphate isomerase RpiA [Legionellales bacterium]
MDQNQLKRAAAQAALAYLPREGVLGVGTGTTTNYLIDLLAQHKGTIEAAVASSEQTAQRLKASGISVIELAHAHEISVYIDGADEVNEAGLCLKGGGGALTREKIVASCAKQFICIVDDTKLVDVLGKKHPVSIEVLPLARSFVAREIVKLGGEPEYREGFKTDNGNIILDIYNLNLTDPYTLEATLNHIPGVVENGIFVKRRADIILVAGMQGVREIKVR